MRRLMFIGPGVIIWAIWALSQPEKVSLTTMLMVIVITLIGLVISLVVYPITEYITIDKWHEKWEEMKDPGWRDIINDARNIPGLKFVLKTGSAIVGTLVARSDAKNTFGIRPEGEAAVEIIRQSQLEGIVVPDGLPGVPESLKRKIESMTQKWEETTT